MPIQNHVLEDHMDPEEPYCDPISMPMPADHHAKLGRFLLLCAEAETVAHIVARRMTTLDDITARILIRQPGFDNLMELITKLAKARGLNADKLSRLADLRKHLRYVYSIRNIIAHQIPNWRDGWVRFDRYATAKDTTDRISLLYVVSLSELDNLMMFARSLLGSLSSIDLDGGAEESGFVSHQSAMTLLETLPLPANPGA
jgi:hypothetical protein